MASGAITSRAANRLDAQLRDLITGENQSCREQSRSNTDWGGGAGERYVSNRRPLAGLSEGTIEPTDAENGVALDATPT